MLHFGFIEDFEVILDIFKDFFATADFNTPPVIEVNLTDTSGKIKWGNSNGVIDFAWYEPWKPYVDGFISGFLLITFTWKLIKDLPNIISGISSSASSSFNSHDGGNEP